MRAIRAGGGPSNAPCAQGDPFEGPGPVLTEGLRRGMTLEKIARTLAPRPGRALTRRRKNAFYTEESVFEGFNIVEH